MTGTDAQAFSTLDGKARFWRVEDGLLTALPEAVDQGAAGQPN
jgi:hypothetical protein